MVTNRPSIFIYTKDADPDFLREIGAGVEEEGVCWEVTERESQDAAILAFEAARDSMLGSGIGICGVDVVLQMRGLPEGHNLSQVHMPTYQQCRALGANSARAIKKQYFKEV